MVTIRDTITINLCVLNMLLGFGIGSKDCEKKSYQGSFPLINKINNYFYTVEKMNDRKEIVNKDNTR